VASLGTDSSGKYYTDVQSQECQCTTSTCGAGMLNAAVALSQALDPEVSIVTDPSTATIGQVVTLDGTGSSAAGGAYITSYYWSVDPNTAISNPTSSIAKLNFPGLRPITVTLKITDSLGRESSASQVVNSKVFPDNNSGGGGLGYETVLALGLTTLVAFLRRRRPTAAMLRARPPRGGSGSYPSLE
jgi:serine protease